MDLLGNTHKDYFYTGVSGVDSKKDIIQGRPHGGVAILWHKSLYNKITVLITGNKRCAISVNISDKQSVLIITVYMPCDSRSHSPDEEYIDVLNNVEQLLIQSSCNCVILCGDMNTSFARNNFHSTYLSQLIIVLVDSCNVTKDTDFSGKDMQVPAHASVQNQPVINWNLLSSDNITNYQILLDSLLSDIVILPHIHTCRDVNCSNIAHTAYIDKYCNEIVDKCIKAVLSAFPLNKSNPDYRNKHRLPEWNTLIKPLRQSSIFWHQLWQACGKPNEGQVAAIMRTTRAKYHRAIKEAKKHIKDRKNNELITQLCCKDYKAFWSNIRNMSRTSNICTENIDGKSNEREICSLLENKYEGHTSKHTY